MATKRRNRAKSTTRPTKALPAKAGRKVTASADARPRVTGTNDGLYDRVALILEEARAQVARTVNTAMVSAYWLIGREIVEVEQGGQERAHYGDELIKQLSRRLVTSFGSGFGQRNLRSMRAFYLAFPAGSALPEIRQALPAKFEKRQAPPATSEPPSFSPAISWTQYLVLLRVTNPAARAFYEIETTRQAWSTRQLERQIAALLYERLAHSRTPDKVLALALDGQEVAKPSDVIKDPFVLEFLELREHAGLHERDVEQAIIDRLETFLLELGKVLNAV